MGFGVALHIHNNVGTNWDHLVLSVLSNVLKGLTHKISRISLVLVGRVNFGMDEMALAWHQRVIGKTDSLIL